MAETPAKAPSKPPAKPRRSVSRKKAAEKPTEQSAEQAAKDAAKKPAEQTGTKALAPNARHVLICLPHYAFSAGVATVAQRQVEMVQALGHRVSICCMTSAMDTGLGEDAPDLYTIGGQDDFNALLRFLRPDTIIAHSMPFYIWIDREPKARDRAIFWDHGEPPPELFPGEVEIRRNIERDRLAALSRLDGTGRVVAISDYIKRADKLTRAPIVFNGVEPWVDEVRERRRASPGPTASILLLQRIGRMEARYKRYDQMFELEEALAEHLTKFRILCAGALSGALPEASERIQYTVNFTPVQKRKMFQTNRFFVSFSEWEGFNLPLVEAQAVGMVGLAKPVSAHLETSALHYRTIGDLALTIAAMTKDEKRYQEYSVSAIEHAARFSWAGMRTYLTEALT
ncbi:MAG: glycosyltransferase family 4 protein [Pseudomonadota bacterium]